MITNLEGTAIVLGFLVLGSGLLVSLFKEPFALADASGLFDYETRLRRPGEELLTSGPQDLLPMN